MTPQYVDGATGMQVGINAAGGATDVENDLKVSEVRQRGENPKAYSQDNLGTRDGFATNFDPSFSYTVSGEIKSVTTGTPDLDEAIGTSSGGATGSHFWNACTIANAIGNLGGIAAGGIYLDSFEIVQTRAPGWFSFTAEYSSNPDIT